MKVVLTISICINVFQALTFWFFLYGFYVREEKLKKELKEGMRNHG